MISFAQAIGSHVIIPSYILTQNILYCVLRSEFLSVFDVDIEDIYLFVILKAKFSLVYSKIATISNHIHTGP